MMRRSLLLSLLCAVAVSASGCKGRSSAVQSEVRGAEQPKAQIYILVDMSETWFNAQSAPLNATVLKEIGEGIAAYAENADPPIVVEHRAIGANSLLRKPLCSVFFMPSLMGPRASDNGRITRPKQLRRYLADHCPQQILSLPAEPLTEISAAVASVSAEPKAAGVRRSIIIASDFLEERPAASDVPLGDLSGDHVLLLYRPLTADQLSPREMTARIASWKVVVERAGAIVSIAPDPSLRRSTIVAFLSQDNK
jgi:hypothetical protein